MPGIAGTRGNSAASSRSLASTDRVAYVAEDNSPVTHAQLDAQFWSDWLADVARVRAQLRSHGYVPVAVASWDVPHLPPKSRGKAAVVTSWKRRTFQDEPDPPSLTALNTGIVCAGLRPVDIDVPNPVRAERVVELANSLFGPTIRRWRANTGKTLLLYRAVEGQPPKRAILGELIDPADPKGLRNKIEILGLGQQFVAHGVHDTGVPLMWGDEAPWTVARDELPAITEDHVSAFLTAAAPLIGSPPEKNDATDTIVGLVGTTAAVAEPVEFTINDLRAMLAEIDGQSDYDRWIKVGMAVWVGSHGMLDGYEAWRQWSSYSVNYSDRACRAKWNNFSRNRPRSIGPAMLLRLARQHQRDFITQSLVAKLAEPDRELRERMRAMAAHSAAHATPATPVAPARSDDPLEQIAQRGLDWAEQKVKPHARRRRLYHKSIVDSSLVKHRVLKDFLTTGDLVQAAAKIAGNAAANAYPLGLGQLSEILREIDNLKR